MISELIAAAIKMKPNLNAFDQRYNVLNSVIYAMDLCRNIIEAAKPVADEVLMITFWEAVDTSISWTGTKGTTLYLGKQLKNANISEIMQKCKMNFAKVGREQFLLYLNQY